MDKDFFLGRLDNEVRKFLSATKEPLRVGAVAVFLCERGTADVRVDYTDYHLEASSLFVYCPYSTLTVVRYSDDVDGVVMRMDLDGLQSTLWAPVDVESMTNIRRYPLRRLDAQQCAVFLEYVRLTRHHQQEAAKVSEQSDPRRFKLNSMQYECLKHALILQVLIIFADNKPLGAISDRKQEVVRSFIISLSQHFRVAHEVGYYAAEQCLSMRHFSTVVRDMTEKTPTEWIAGALLAEARRLLTETDKTVSEISDELHFPSQSYFGKWFKQRVGVDPLKFRKQTLTQS